MVKQKRFVRKVIWHKYNVNAIDIFFLLLFLSAGSIGGTLTKNIFFPIMFFVGYCLYLLSNHIENKEIYYEEI